MVRLHGGDDFVYRYTVTRCRREVIVTRREAGGENGGWALHRPGDDVTPGADARRARLETAQ